MNTLEAYEHPLRLLVLDHLDFDTLEDFCTGGSGLVVDFDEELVERLVRAAREAGPLAGPTVPLMIDGAVVGRSKPLLASRACCAQAV